LKPFKIVIQLSSFKDNLVCSWNYWGSSLLDTLEEMGVQWDSTSDVQRLHLGEKYYTTFSWNMV
jgi:hypothetical protein